MHASIKLALATAAVASFGLVGAPGASGTTQHCDSSAYPNKININGGPTVQTNLAPGTQVCIKSSTFIAYVTVDSSGKITNNQIFNQNGKAQGISYYAWNGEPCTPNPSNPSQCLPS